MFGLVQSCDISLSSCKKIMFKITLENSVSSKSFLETMKHLGMP